MLLTIILVTILHLLLLIATVVSIAITVGIKVVLIVPIRTLMLTIIVITAVTMLIFAVTTSTTQALLRRMVALDALGREEAALKDCLALGCCICLYSSYSYILWSMFDVMHELLQSNHAL